MPLQLGGGPKCGVCQKSVYFNEEKRAIGKVFHTGCFKCASCSKILDSTNCSEHDDQVYCNACYRKNFGPKGYGFAAGGAGLSTTSGGAGPVGGSTNGTNGTVDRSDPENCPTCGKRVYFAEQILALKRKWHKLCFKCTTCRKALDSTNCTEHDESPYCKNCYAKNFGPKGYGFAGGAAGLATGPSANGNGHHHYPANGAGDVVDHSDPDNCPRCGKKVYFAEQVLSLNKKWHKLCFKCANCSKTVDSSSATDHDNELYCKGCHGRLFGPKGVGYGIGAGTLQTN